MKAPRHFSRYLGLAARIIAKGRLPRLILSVARKGDRQRGRLGAAFAQLQLLMALCLAWWRGEYREVSRSAVLASVAALAYFLAPLDMVPDFVFGFGLLDDLAVLAWVARRWGDELEAFRQWQARRAQPLALPSPEELRRPTPAESDVHG